MTFLIGVITICKHVKYFMGSHKLGTSTIGLFLQQFKAWGKFHFHNPPKSKTQQNHFFWMLSWCGEMGLSTKAKIPNFACLDQKHKRGICKKTPHFLFTYGFVFILMMFFNFQDVGEVNGI
jgi:hypothetical protein